MYRPTNPAEVKLALSIHVFEPRFLSEMRSIKAPKPPLEYLLRFYYEQEQVQLRANVDNQLTYWWLQRNIAERHIIELVNASPVEWQEACETLADQLADLSNRDHLDALGDCAIAEEVLWNRENPDDDEEDDIDTSGRGGDRYGSQS